MLWSIKYKLFFVEIFWIFIFMKFDRVDDFGFIFFYKFNIIFYVVFIFIGVCIINSIMNVVVIIVIRMCFWYKII